MFNSIHGFQNASCQHIRYYHSSSKFLEWIRVACFQCPYSIDITIFREIAAPAKRIPIITSMIFSIISSLTLLGLPALVNWHSLDSGSFAFFFLIIYSTSLKFMLWIVRTKMLPSSLCTVTQVMFSILALMKMECSKHKCFFLFWIEVVDFSSLLIVSVSANVTCSDDPAKWGVEFT